MPTIGQRLKAAREAQRLTLEQAFEATRIRVVYLRALEEDNLSVMPSPVQARGYLRNYAEYLGLDLTRLLEEVRASQQVEAEVIGPADETPAAPPPQDIPLHTPPPLEPAPSAESQPEPTPPQPKRRTRKKAELSLAEESVPAKPKKRTRKKSEAESLSETLQPAPPQPQPYTLPPAEQPSQPDLSEQRWQAWLDRSAAVINQSKPAKETPADGQPAETIEAQPDALPSETPQPSEAKVENSQSSAEIFKEIGKELRARREMLSLHLEEVERNTRVKTHYLEALEQGDMERLPSAVQTRGMLSNYASFLDLDVDAILLRFADALQARHREKNPQRPGRKAGQPIFASLPALGNFIAGDLIFGIGMAVLLVGFVIWGINRVLVLQSLQAVEPTAPSISDVLISTPDPSQFTATPTLLPVEAFAAEEATATIIIPTLNANVRVQVNLVAVERTYLRVIADGKIVFEGRVIAGNAYLFEAEEQIEVLTGSGGAIRLVYNGRDMGLMGGFGQIAHNIYRANEIITPTPLPTPSPTVTAPPSPTLRPTNTPTPTNTPFP